MTGPVAQASRPRRYPVPALRDFVAVFLERYGVPAADAATAAARMVEADLRGMHGHGIFRLPTIIERLEHGGCNVAPRVATVRETPVSALVDGDNGLGQVVMTAAARIAIRKAKDQGLAWVGVRGSNHAGAGGVYAAMALDHDMVGVYLAVGNANHVPPWGGVDPLLGTEPIAVAVPAGAQPPLVLDMATTVASFGRVRVAAQRGERLPVGWMTDRRGQPLTDPAWAADGLLAPIGGYKGYGLALVIGALAGALNGAALGGALVDVEHDPRTPTNTGQAIFVLRPDLLRPVEEFKADMDRRILELRTSIPLEGGPAVRVPGDRAPEQAARMQDTGVPLDARTVEKLAALAKREGIATDPFEDRGDHRQPGRPAEPGSGRGP